MHGNTHKHLRDITGSNLKVLTRLKDLQGLTTYKNLTEQRRDFLFDTVASVSKHCVHSSMTTLSGLPRAARVAAWQCSSLHTVMSPSIHSFVSELCQDRQRAWGRLRDSTGDRKRQSGKKSTKNRENRLQKKVRDIKKEDIPVEMKTGDQRRQREKKLINHSRFSLNLCKQSTSKHFFKQSEGSALI